MTRKDARELTMQIIFQMEAQNDFDQSNFEKYISDKKILNQRDYIQSVFDIICTKHEEIDSKINKYSTVWQTGRMPKADLAITRLSVAEIIFLDDVPTSVSINEAVNLAKTYGTNESSKYINAILGKVEKDNE